MLCYLHRTRTLGLRYEASPRPLHRYSDSDWAVKHSTSGWVFVLNQAAISWGSKKQKSVALSSCEAEIVAGSEAAKDAVALSTGLAKDLGMGTAERGPRRVDDGQPLRDRCGLQPRACGSSEACRPATLLHP